MKSAISLALMACTALIACGGGSSSSGKVPLPEEQQIAGNPTELDKNGNLVIDAAGTNIVIDPARIATVADTIEAEGAIYTAVGNSEYIAIAGVADGPSVSAASVHQTANTQAGGLFSFLGGNLTDPSVVANLAPNLKYAGELAFNSKGSFESGRFDAVGNRVMDPAYTGTSATNGRLGIDINVDLNQGRVTAETKNYSGSGRDDHIDGS